MLLFAPEVREGVLFEQLQRRRISTKSAALLDPVKWCFHYVWSLARKLAVGLLFCREFYAMPKGSIALTNFI
jgi:hypothetical protein